MPVVISLMLMLSGAIMVGSIMFARRWLANATASHRQAAIFSGVGVGVSAALFTYFGIGNSDPFVAIFVGVIIAITGTFAAWFTFRGRR